MTLERLWRKMRVEVGGGDVKGDNVGGGMKLLLLEDVVFALEALK